MKAFKLAARLVKLNGNVPTTRPLKGVLMTSISNYILKSRNDYNEDNICKYVSADVAEKSVENHEIWMSIIENLNDERERRVVPEFFDEEGWNSFSWVKGLNLEPTRTYYVSSFCKTLNDTNMQRDYGTCIYGYKDDRMADILAPTMFHKYSSNGNKVPVFSQVVAFDVIYDRDEAKEEINFLCSIIDCFDMRDEDKKHFLEEILQYWILSVKDKEWSHERERRYVLFMYDNYEYTEVDLRDSRFLKMKTSLFLHPDFVLGENPVKLYLRTFVDNKRHAISMKQYIFCRDCFNRDFDALSGVNQNTISCSICNSSNVSHEMPRTK